MTKYITIRNDYHHTAARIRADLPLTARRMRDIRRRLCGVTGCTCGGLVGERGPQDRNAGEWLADQMDSVSEL